MSKKNTVNPFFYFNANILPYVTAFFVGMYFIFFRIHSIVLVLSVVVVAWLSAFLLKVIFRELRPNNSKTPTLFSKEARFSFPSEHSSIFAALGGICYSINHSLGVIVLSIAFLIGISRAIIGVHYWKDIIAGWTLGIIIAILFV
jgi:undecaprenyl-diphosphatase